MKGWTLLGKVIAVFVALATLYGTWYVYHNILTDGRTEDVARRLSDKTASEYIIDADTANEIDDLFAIVGALAREKTRTGGPKLAGITAAHFRTSPLATRESVTESQAINQELVRLMELPFLRTLEGANGPLKTKDKPRRSDAAVFILERASLATRDDKLQIFVLGPCTNVASALLLDPEIAEKIHVRYLGFWYDAESGEYDKDEFNTNNDPLALNLLLDNPKLEFTVMTATTSETLQMRRSDLDARLPTDHKVTRYLRNRWDAYNRWWTDEDPEKTRWAMWDVASLEAWFSPELATLEERPAPPENGRETLRVFTDIDEEALLDRWFERVNGAID